MRPLYQDIVSSIPFLPPSTWLQILLLKFKNDFCFVSLNIVCMYTYGVYMCLCVWIQACMCICWCLYMCACVYVLCVHVCVYMYKCVFVCMCVCVYVNHLSQVLVLTFSPLFETRSLSSLVISSYAKLVALGLAVVSCLYFPSHCENAGFKVMLIKTQVLLFVRLNLAPEVTSPAPCFLSETVSGSLGWT